MPDGFPRRVTMWTSIAVVALGAGRPSDADRVARIERALNLPELMKRHSIPGISVAVIEDFKTVWAKGYGVTERGGSVQVTPQTLFLAGSISKPVAGLGALSLVERGRLSLAEDVNAKLKTWKVPENEYTTRQKVTLALILDHTAGFVGGDFYPGDEVARPLPLLLQILNGQKPANSAPVRLGFVPGTKWQYSGAGYLVAQQLMIDAAGQPFPELMRSAVFTKIGMTDTTYEQPLPLSRTTSAASGTLLDGTPVNGKWHVQPEMAAGGLWSTPSDLAKLAIEIAVSLQGKANHVLSQRMTREMITTHCERGVTNILGTPEDPDRMGFGFFVGKDDRFGHIGGNVGYQATFVMFGKSGNGAVIMTNSDIGLRVGNALLNEIAKEYGWNYTAPAPP